jgi:hypothetical protein
MNIWHEAMARGVIFHCGLGLSVIIDLNHEMALNVQVLDICPVAFERHFATI